MKIFRQCCILMALLFSAGEVSAQLSANFTSNTQSGCVPVIVSFTDQSTGNPTSWQWSFGNGSTSTNQNPTAVYNNPGIYTVRLIVSDGSTSDTLIQTNYITVNPRPTAGFSAVPVIGCAPLTVNFNDISVANTGTITNWLWDFGDGNISTQQNPVHTYNSIGNYSVTLVVTNSAGCNSNVTYQNFVQVTPFPEADFDVVDNILCEVPEEVSFTNLSTGPPGMTYFWDFGDGNNSTDENPTHLYTQEGSYNVTLFATDPSGCTDSLTINNAVQVQSYTTDFSVNQAIRCVNQAFQFNALTNVPAATYQWNFGGEGSSTQANPSYTFSNPGVYDIELIVVYPDGCSDTVVKPQFVEATPIPTASFTVPNNTSCQVPFTVQFNDQSTDATSWLWNFGGGNTSTQQNPTFTYTTPGNKNVSLTVTNAGGCSHQVTVNAAVQISLPQANFSVDVTSGCNPLEVNFTNNSSSNLSPISSYNWDFGDGSLSNDTNPTHIYTSSGSFQPSLTVETVDGCTRTFNGPMIMVGDTPVVNFSAMPLQGCYQQTVAFFDSSSADVNTWQWDFGDGSTSNQQNPTNTYDDLGVFDVTLIASNNGCSDTLTIPNYITISPPIPEFTFSVNCEPDLVFNFQDQSTGANQWLWNFGDGNTSTEQNPSHAYNTTGSYTVNLTVWDTVSGCEQSINATVQATLPEASFTSNITEGCYPLTVDFTNTSAFTGTTTWFIPSGNLQGNGQNTSFTFNNPGNYDVTMVNCDANGCCDTIHVENYIHVYGTIPEFTASPTAGCPPFTTQFTDQTVAPNSGIESWSWTFGGGATSDQQNPSHTYPNSGTYTVVLTVTDSFGCVNSRTRNNYIRVTKPRPSFTLESGVYCLGQSVQFTNTTQTTNNSTYLWDFGDGNTANVSNPSHTYETYGTFDITLTVTDNNGCDSTIVVQNAVTIEDPIVDFYSDTTFANCPPLLVNFFDSSSYSLPATAWQWNFGDNSGSSNQNPSNIYSSPGIYDVELIVTFENGCTDTLVKPEMIDILGPTADIEVEPMFGCPPLEVHFTANAVQAVEIIWDFGDGNVIFGDDTINHVYQNIGNFLPAVILTDSTGCTFVQEADFEIQIDTPSAGFYTDITVACQPVTVSFFDSSFTNTDVPIESYFWDFGDGNTDTVQNPQHFYDTSGVFMTSLVVTNIFGCTDTFFKEIEILPQPNAAFTVSDTVSCAPVSIEFLDISTADTALTVRVWDFGDGTISILENPTHDYLVGGDYTVTLIVTDARGCSDTATQELNILPQPSGIFTPDSEICFGDSIQLESDTDHPTYSWSPSASLSDPNIPNPIAFPDTTTAYILEILSNQGCIATDTVQITVNPLPSLDITADTAICYGDTIQLNAVGGISFTWSPPEGLSQSNIPNPLAFPLETTTYFVTNVDTNNCENTDSVLITVNRVTAIFDEPVACFGDSVFFTDNSISLNGSVNSWSWDFNDNLPLSNEQNPVHLYSDSGTYAVNLTVTDTDNCTHDTIVDVTVSPLPNATIEFPPFICQNNEAEFYDNSSGQFDIVAWEWDFGEGGPLIFDQNPAYTYSDSGFFDIRLVVTDTNACTDTIIETVYVHLQPTAEFLVENVCDGVQIETENLSTGVNPINTTSWSFGDGNTSNEFSPEHLYSQHGNYDITLTITDSIGCIADVSNPVQIYELPQAIIQNEDICLGDAALFSDQSIPGDGALSSAVWLPGDGSNALVGNDVFYVYPDSGDFNLSLIIFDEFGCSDTISGFQRVDFPATAFAFGDTLICFGDTAQILGGGGDTLFWTPALYLDDAFSGNPSAFPETTTDFILHTTNGVCPFDTAIVTVEVKPLPFVQTIEDREILWSTTVELFTEVDFDVVNVSWSPPDSLSCTDCTSPMANPEESTLYTVTVTDELGCINSDQVFLNVITRCDPDLIFVPNTFTPDGDGINDILYARLFGVKEITYFRVFDRWGTLLFETRDHEIGWNGTDLNGRKLNSGVYVYTVEAVCYNGQTVIKQGNVTLLK